MKCPDHKEDVTRCRCNLADDLIELSGKQMSDGMDQNQADKLALELLVDKGQGKLF